MGSKFWLSGRGGVGIIYGGDCREGGGLLCKIYFQWKEKKWVGNVYEFISDSKWLWACVERERVCLCVGSSFFFLQIPAEQNCFLLQVIQNTHLGEGGNFIELPGLENVQETFHIEHLCIIFFFFPTSGGKWQFFKIFFILFEKEVL